MLETGESLSTESESSLFLHIILEHCVVSMVENIYVAYATSAEEMPFYIYT